MPTPAAIVLMAFAISSTWSSFFWEPRADYAFIFGWVITALLLLIPSPKGQTKRQAICFLPSLVPLIVFIFTQPLYEGWSVQFTACLAVSLCLYLVGHLAFHFEALLSVKPSLELNLSLPAKIGFALTKSLRVAAAVFWLSVYFSIFYLELNTGFPNSDTPMIWLLNVVFVCLVFGFSALILSPLRKVNFTLSLMESACAAFALAFLLAYFATASGITGPAGVLSNSELFVYLNVTPAFFAISLLLLAICRAPSAQNLNSQASFRLINEPR